MSRLLKLLPHNNWSSVAGVFLAGFLFVGPKVCAAAGQENAVRATILTDRKAVAPGESFRIGVLFTIKPGWHIYWMNPGDSGLPTKVTYTPVNTAEIGAADWPIPKRFLQGADIVGFGYEGELLLASEVTVSSAASGPIPISAAVSWLECSSTLCVPGKTMATIQVDAKKGAVSAPTEEARIFDEWKKKLPAPADTLKLPDDKRTFLLTNAPTQVRIDIPGSAGIENLVEWFPPNDPALNLQDIRVEKGAGGGSLLFTASILEGQKLRDSAFVSVLTYKDPVGEVRGVVLPLHFAPQ